MHKRLGGNWKRTGMDRIYQEVRCVTFRASLDIQNRNILVAKQSVMTPYLNILATVRN